MTALAPFSQNSAVCRWLGSGSGQAQPWQSNPSAWLSRSSVCAVRRTPICSTARFIAIATAGTPAADFFGALDLESLLVDVVLRCSPAHVPILPRASTTIPYPPAQHRMRHLQ